MRRFSVAPLVALIAVVVAAPAQAAGCAGADDPVSSARLPRAEHSVRCLVNEERLALGLPRLRESSPLASVARSRARSMVVHQQFGHEDAAGGVAERALALGYRWSRIAENIATGQSTPRDVFDGWMASEGHCRNILSPDVSDLGIGVVARGALPGIPQGATWSQVFGHRMGSPVAHVSSAAQARCPYAGVS